MPKPKFKRVYNTFTGDVALIEISRQRSFICGGCGKSTSDPHWLVHEAESHNPTEIWADCPECTEHLLTGEWSTGEWVEIQESQIDWNLVAGCCYA